MEPKEKTEFEKHKEITDNFLSGLKKEEPKGASPEKAGESSSPAVSEKEKTEGEGEKREEEEKNIVRKAEEKAKEDEKILSSPDEELKEEDLTRKKELLSKRNPEETKQEKLDKRFAELTGEIKDLKRGKDTDKEQIRKLEEALAKVKAEIAPSEEDVAMSAQREEQERFQKYIREDEDKKRENKREMTKEDLAEWLLEDSTAAEEWLAERSMRRAEERRTEKSKKAEDARIEGLTDKMHTSAQRVQEKHPELNTKSREEELKKQGKTDKEINDVLCGENMKYKAMMEIIRENPEKYWVDNGPELAAEEMEKRLKLSTKSPAKKTFTEEEVERIKAEAVEEEKARMAGIDEGTGSSRPSQTAKSELSPDMEGKLAEILKRSGVTREEFDQSRDRRKKIGL